MRALAGRLLVSCLLAGGPFAVAGCAPTVGRCYADDVTFLAEADDESVIEIALADCITGDVLVEDTEVGTLELPLLESIGGSLVISFNVALERVSLPVLAEVGGVLEIAGNPVLDELALPALERVGGALVVSGNTALDEEDVEREVADVDVGGEVTVRP